LAKQGHGKLSVVIWVLIGLGMYANPFLILSAWIFRMRARGDGSWRSRAGWVSLVLATCSFLVLVGFVTLGPEPATAGFDVWFKKCFRIGAVISIAAFVAGCFGKGRMQWLVPLSALLSPMTILVQKVME
jgi:uncharacterized membrane protein